VSVRERPPVSYTRGPVTAALRYVGPAAALIGVVALAIGYTWLPETVPTHFGIAGEADDFGPRWSVLVLAGVWLVAQAGLALLSNRPQYFNYPSGVTQQNAQRLYREGERMLVWLGVAVAVTFAGPALTILGVQSMWLAVLGLIATFAAMIVGITRCLKAA
jgi:hypothetical protein